MFRAVFVAIVALTLSITVVASYTTHQSKARESIEAGVSQSLRGAATLAVLERDTEVASVRAKATFVSADVGLAEAITKSYLAELPEAEGDTANDRAAKAAHERHIKVHERLLSYEKRFELYSKGEGKGKRDLELPLRYRGNTQPDLFLAVDSGGVGLAALGKDLFDWYGEDLSEEYPEIATAMTSKSVQTAIWEFGFAKQGDEKSLYTVAVSPVFKDGEGEAVGAIVVGNLFNDGVAASTRDYVAGVDGFVEIHGRDGSPSEDEEVAAARRGVEAALADAPHVAFVRGDGVIASSMDPATEKATAARLADALKGGIPDELIRLEDPDGEAPTLLVRGQELPRRKGDGTNTGVVVIKDLSAALAPMEEPARQSLIWFVLSLLLGTVGVLAVFQIFLKPVGDVESGIQEIIAGNKDYAFQAPNWHKTASSLAQQLNLMSAFLQGKPMPDDDGVAGSNWGDFGGGGGAKQAPQGGSQVQGVSMQDLMGRKPSDDA